MAKGMWGRMVTGKRVGRGNQKHSVSGASSCEHNQGWSTNSPAVARVRKSTRSIGSSNEHKPSASFSVNRYFSTITRLSGQGLSDLI